MREFKASRIQASLICVSVCPEFPGDCYSYTIPVQKCVSPSTRSLYNRDRSLPRTSVYAWCSFASPRLPGCFSTSWIDMPDETRIVGLTALESTLPKVYQNKGLYQRLCI